MTYYYICDKCGELSNTSAEPLPDEDAACTHCGSLAVWEFENKSNALRHSAHIQKLLNSGLVRRAR